MVARAAASFVLAFAAAGRSGGCDAVVEAAAAAFVASTEAAGDNPGE